jgi:hypothetical protein
MRNRSLATREFNHKIFGSTFSRAVQAHSSIAPIWCMMTETHHFEARRTIWASSFQTGAHSSTKEQHDDH